MRTITPPQSGHNQKLVAALAAAGAVTVAPASSLVLYRECDGAVVLRSKVLLIAGAFPIQLLAGSRLYEPMGIGLSRAW